METPDQETAIEQEIQDKGLVAPRVTPDQIDALMTDINIHCFRIPTTTTVVATAYLTYGFTIATEISACASPENFDYALGVKIATGKVEAAARNELWKLEGYRLKMNLEAAGSL